MVEKVIHEKGSSQLGKNGIIYANDGGSIYKVNLRTKSVINVGEVYKGELYLTKKTSKGYNGKSIIINDIEGEVYQELYLSMVRYANKYYEGQDGRRDAVEWFSVDMYHGDILYNRLRYGEYFVKGDSSFKSQVIGTLESKLSNRQIVELYKDKNYEEFCESDEVKDIIIHSLKEQRIILQKVKTWKVEENIEKYKRQYKYVRILENKNIKHDDKLEIEYDTEKITPILDEIIKRYTLCRLTDENINFNIQDVKDMKKKGITFYARKSDLNLGHLGETVLYFVSMMNFAGDIAKALYINVEEFNDEDFSTKVVMTFSNFDNVASIKYKGKDLLEL